MMGKLLILFILPASIFASSLTFFGESSQDGYKYLQVRYLQKLSDSIQFELQGGGAQIDGVPSSGNASFYWSNRVSDFLKIGLGGRYLKDGSIFSPGFGALFDITMTISEWWQGELFTDFTIKSEYMSYATPFPKKRLGQFGIGAELAQDVTKWFLVGISFKKFSYSLKTTGGSSTDLTRKLSSKLGGMDGYPDIEGSLFFDVMIGKKWSLGFSYATMTYLEEIPKLQSSSITLNYQASKAIGLGVSFVRFKDSATSSLAGLEFSYAW